MNYLKKTRRPKTTNNAHNIEGVRVNGKARKDPESSSEASAGYLSKFSRFILKTIVWETARWGFRNWPLIQENALKLLEAFLEMFN